MFFPIEEPSSIVSSNQTIILGSSVSLYCITNGKTSNTWYKDGHTLGSNFNWTVFGHMNEVLVVRNATMEADGQYSCVGDDNTVMTMQLDVLSKHTVFPCTYAVSCICITCIILFQHCLNLVACLFTQPHPLWLVFRCWATPLTISLSSSHPLFILSLSLVPLTPIILT